MNTSTASNPRTVNSRQRRWVEHWIAGLCLAMFVGLLYAVLLASNRVLATGDILLYFYPYRQYVAETLRTGQLPFWNPYLFMGAPLLANPQAAVLYPLHWPLIWLPVTKQIYWSAALHTWLLACGGYALVRSWGYGWASGLVTALVLAGSGFVGGLLGHINQLNAAAWLPWGLLCIEWAVRDGRQADVAGRPWWRSTHLILPTLSFGLIVALMVLAGHTQTLYINLFGAGLWAIWPAVTRGLRWAQDRIRHRRLDRPPAGSPTRRTAVRDRLIVYAGGVLLGLLLSGVQLLPTLELSIHGLRSGGLSYQEATSFSLKPLQLGWSLLPTYGVVNLEAIFDTPGYTEYVAYIGLIGLLLGFLGIWNGRGPAHTFGILFAVVGLLLALGRWNPLYFVLYVVMPGFDLFRAPARWIMLYTLGMAVLAGIGADSALNWASGRSATFSPSRRRAWAAGTMLALLLGIELLLAAQAQPHTHPTAPDAVYGVRTAPAHLLTAPDRASTGDVAAGRFLGISTITYDPGDMADYRRIYLETQPAQLTTTTFQDLVIAQKVQELLVPNLPLFWRIPSVDGFDGGVLPLQRYNAFVQALVPPDRLVPDGRLREQIRDFPSADLLGLMNVQYVITDKVRDLWYEDVYYDRQIGARLAATAPPVTIAVPQPFEATHIDLIGYVDPSTAMVEQIAAAAEPVATVDVVDALGERVAFTVTAGGAPPANLADGRLDSALAAHSGATIAFRDVEGGRQEYRVRLPLPTPLAPTQVELRALDPEVPVVVQAVTLYDRRTGMFSALLPSDRGNFRLVHSGDVKVYENLDVRPRAYLAGHAEPVTDAAAAASRLADSQTWSAAVWVEGGKALDSRLTPADSATVVTYAPERVEIMTHSTEPALLVLSDSYYPGWQATVDGIPAPVYPANILFRGVYVPPGEHRVVFSYRPTYWVAGLVSTFLGTMTVLVGIVLWATPHFRRRRADAV